MSADWLAVAERDYPNIAQGHMPTIASLLQAVDSVNGSMKGTWTAAQHARLHEAMNDLVRTLAIVSRVLRRPE